jgi:hypothetical protein
MGVSTFEIMPVEYGDILPNKQATYYKHAVEEYWSRCLSKVFDLIPCRAASPFCEKTGCIIYTSVSLRMALRLLHAEKVEPPAPLRTVRILVISVYGVSVVAKHRARENLIFWC